MPELIDSRTNIMQIPPERERERARRPAGGSLRELPTHAALICPLGVTLNKSPPQKKQLLLFFFFSFFSLLSLFSAARCVRNPECGFSLRDVRESEGDVSELVTPAKLGNF